MGTKFGPSERGRARLIFRAARMRINSFARPQFRSRWTGTLATQAILFAIRCSHYSPFATIRCSQFTTIRYSLFGFSRHPWSILNGLKNCVTLWKDPRSRALGQVAAGSARGQQVVQGVQKIPKCTMGLRDWEKERWRTKSCLFLMEN